MEDIAIVKSIVNMTVLSICDPNMIRDILHLSMEYPGPMYIRLAQGKKDRQLYEPGTIPFSIGGSVTARDGKDFTIIAHGEMVGEALDAAEELAKDGIDVRVACDNACALLMQKGLVQCVVVGADRIAANGDAANKIGTFGVALLARHFGIPFYVAAPLSTIDPRTPDGAHIPIEERPDREVTHVGETRIVPEGVPVFNFAFDVTPADCITGIITEKGVLRAPYGPAIAAALKA